MPSPTSFLRRGLAASLAAVLVCWVSPSHAAAESASIARVARDGTAGENLHFTTGDSATTTLFDLRVDDDTTVSAYCVDVSTNVDHQAAYAETGWTEELPGSTEAGEVTWIVRNSYPALPLERVAAESGITDLSAEQAIAATQAAIWYFTNGIQLALDETGDANSPQVRALYQYLLAGAVDAAEPGPALHLSPTEVAGDSPTSLDPLTVHTTSEAPVLLTVNGAQDAALVDENGDPVSEARDGDEVLLALPADVDGGAATVYAHAEEALVPTGRVYTGKDGVQTQPLVAAEPATAALTVSVKVSWNASESAAPLDPPAPATAAPLAAGPDRPDAADAPPAGEAAPPSTTIAEDKRAETDLAFTGTWLGAIVAAALVLVGAGAALLLAVRGRLRR